MTDETRWDEANELWDEFLIKFPAGKIESMTLAEYTALTKECEAVLKRRLYRSKLRQELACVKQFKSRDCVAYFWRIPV
jgi:hypothetical protein